MARLYADENFDHRVVEQLRLLGHDVLTVQDAGNANQRIGDPAVLAYAIADRRAAITFNRGDYIRLHRRVRPHAGIIVCTDDHDRLRLATRIHQALVSAPSLDNQLIRVYKPSKP